MTSTTYTSKKIGDIEVIHEGTYITINTKRLQLLSLNQLDKPYLIDRYTSLLSNPKNITLYAEGETWGRSRVDELITTGQNKWNKGHPFSVFAVYNRESGLFMGTLSTRDTLDDYALIGEGHANVTEIGYVLDNKFWGAGYGTEIAIASKKYIKDAIAKLQCEGVQDTPKEIVATVHPDNIPSKMILQKTLKKQADELMFKFGGQPRLLFFKPLKQEMLNIQTNEMYHAKL